MGGQLDGQWAPWGWVYGKGPSSAQARWEPSAVCHQSLGLAPKESTLLWVAEGLVEGGFNFKAWQGLGGPSLPLGYF